ncbi:kinase suppressor of ras isoform X2 [Oratosquilla oratoria]|uniref:kinase suppressor of ras isoform X2 n=1 Tax=Oratosquilla oratoria TaxID=337810 RepID=UPI003F774E0F
MSSETSRSDGGAEEGQSPEEVVRRAVETCSTLHQFIVSHAEHLEGLRTHCATTAQLTQQEIRTLEVKLVRLFSDQLLTKRNLPNTAAMPEELQQYPSLKQWLQVVGLCKHSVNGMCQKVSSLECLLEKREQELRNLLADNGANPSEANKLVRALRNLKRYTDSQMQGQSDQTNTDPLYWDSWERSCPSPRLGRSQREARSSLSSNDGEGSCGDCKTSSASGGRSDDSSTPSSPPFVSLSPGGPHGVSTLNIPVTSFVTTEKRYTPPPTPSISSKGKGAEKVKFPTTPPPGKKFQTGLLNITPLGRSTSHESQLSHRVDNQDSTLLSPLWLGGSMEQLVSRRNRLHSESGTETVAAPPGDGKIPTGSAGSRNDVREISNVWTTHYSPAPSTLASPIKSPHCIESTPEESHHKQSTLVVPKSPRTPTLPGSVVTMVHNVQHRFTKTFKPNQTCGFCGLKFTLFGGLKCKECNFKCHKECESKVPPSCGLPVEFLKMFEKHLKGPDSTGMIGIRGVSQSLSHHPNIDTYSFKDHVGPISSLSGSQPSINIAPFPGPDSSSNTSSCNSSTPSSPALIVSSPANKGAFHFPGDGDHDRDIPLEMRPLTHFPHKPLPPPSSTSHSDVIDSRHSHDSDRTVSQTSGSGSTGTDDSERTLNGRVDSQDSTVSDGEANDPRCTRQNSVSSVSQSLREWDIPYDELHHGEVIGRGRFGIVYSGNWHGQVAIKELHMDYVNEEKTLEAFKAEVSTFRKTRHENLVLFMGACMKPPSLAIVTSLCKGMTLYKHIHVMKDKFNMSKTIHFSQQILQGMGYLHARGIVHKDLKTKNIFIENGKVVITDFGLFNVTRLCHNNRRGNWLSIPPGWLCYLSPEIMRSLRVAQKQDENLPFTTYSDIYAFGTVWYELLCGEWPHRGLPPEAIIWQVGRGMKPSLAHLQASRDVKDILMACWSFCPTDRPEFSALQQNLKKIPRKRLARSPSHPIHLSRSAESVF